MPQARNQTLRNEPVNTRYGVIDLDEKGYATNLAELGVKDQDVIDNVPGFFDGQALSGGEPAKATPPPPPPVAEPGTVQPDQSVLAEFIDPEDLRVLTPEEATDHDANKDGNEPSDDQVWAIIQVLPSGAFNTQGYADMKVLNARLKEQGFETITGTRRLQITDARKQT